jgi:hypothetical protein
MKLHSVKFLLAGLVCAFAADPLGAQPVWSTSVQTGFADTFQLTLGGTFGAGPGWQNKVTTGVANAFRNGDSVFVYGWDTFDAPTHRNDWQAGLGYRAPVLKRRNFYLSLGSGLQHWRFPGVKTGTNDWLIPGNLVLQTSIRKLPLTVTSDSWSLFSSPLQTGSLVHTQSWLQHRILKRDSLQIAFKHGPAHTYSWKFYGTDGNRVIRYQSMVVITRGATSFEAGYRKQWGLQHGICNNRYWQFSVTRTLFAKRL